MTNIVLLVRDRPRLTEQCLRTLYECTEPGSFNLTVLDDGSRPETARIIDSYQSQKLNMETVRFILPVGIVGFLRNVGAGASERFFGRGEFLYFSDNDVAFLPGWLPAMQNRMKLVQVSYQRMDLCFVAGGYQHPYHATNTDLQCFHETDAVAGYSHLMTWDTWDGFGPYESHAKGVCQSEDHAFCQKVSNAAGGRTVVGYVHPPVILNCGITNSEGKPAIGSEAFEHREGYIYE